MLTQTVLQITREQDNTWTIGHPENASVEAPTVSANSDTQSLPEALNELKEYETLAYEHDLEFDPVIADNTPEELQRRLEYYQKINKNYEEIRRKVTGWRFLKMTDEQLERIDVLIRKQNQSIQNTQRQTEAIYQ